MFRPNFVAVVVCLCAGMVPAVVASAKPPLQTAGNGVKVDPIRVASVKVVDGRLQVGEWIDYNPFGGRSNETCLFDCFGRAWGPGSTGEPVGADVACAPFGMAPDSRWFYGRDYYLPYTADDFSKWESGTIESIGAAWWWLNDPERSQPCLIAFLLSEDGLDTRCMVSPDSNRISAGIILDFGVLTGRMDGYYYTRAIRLDILAQSMPQVQDGAASHLLVLAQSVEGGSLVLADGPCQFMIWGPGTQRHDGLNACGDQAEITFEDDQPTDGVLSAPVECYDLSYDGCRFTLGKCVCFGAVGCRPDYNGDGFVTGEDFGTFVHDFEEGNDPADYDGNGFVTGDDFDLFVIDFEVGC